MKTGWLVVNHFLATNKFTEHYDWLREAAEKVNITLSLKTGVELMNEIGNGLLSPEPLPDFVLFWDKDTRLASALEQMGLKVFNNARAIGVCDDKSLTHLALAGHIPMPRTICAPMTYPAVGYPDLSFVKQAAEALGLPMVMKECYGSFGFQVYLANTLEEAEELAKKLAGTPFIMQEFIAASLGRDVRLQVVGDQVVAAMYRYNDNGDFRANITNGGKMKAYEPTEEQCKLALSACRILGLDFAGVDFLFGQEGEPVLCEINSNAHFKNLYSCTGVNVAEAILDHIAKNI
ncbi:MAG: RimK family alpha-L-glutamate ligase [Clostridia bacterium]|nr:RimK family alpha-L-glutamate ligase [Clostridia bacterium]